LSPAPPCANRICRSRSLAGPESEIALLLDHRANLVVERTRSRTRIRWLLLELDLTLYLAGGSLDNYKVLDRLKRRLAKQPPSVLLRIGRELPARIYELTRQIRELDRCCSPRGPGRAMAR
jgi:transposase